MGPKLLRVRLFSDRSYYMEVDTKKRNCTKDEQPHWHLCRHGKRIGQITVWGVWKVFPDVAPEVKREAEILTVRNAPEIFNFYYYNASYGYDF